MATWVDTDYVRGITGLTSEDISDEDLEFFIEVSQKEILMKINEQETREPVNFLDQTRDNDIDGLNVDYYIANWEGNWISDYNYDLEVGTSDVIVYSVDTDGVETKPAIASITPAEGKITLSTAQNNATLAITYAYSNIDPVTPDPRLMLAAGYLTAAYSYLRLSEGGKTDVRFGNTVIKENLMANSESYFTKYTQLIDVITQSVDGGVLYGFNVNQI